MKEAERKLIVDLLPYEFRLGFIAFCLERCFKEARRHLTASEQLDRLPLLREGLEMLWSRAEHAVLSDPERINLILQHVLTYETPAKDQENVIYSSDITLVEGARLLGKGMRVLQDPGMATSRYVATALSAPYIAVAQIYSDYQYAREAEKAIAEAALLRLREGISRPFSRRLFEGIPDWPRGDLSKQYAEGRLTGTAEEEDG